MSAHSGGSPEVSKAFLAMLIFCTEYFHNDILSPFSQSLTPHFQMFTLPTQDQTFCGQTTQTEIAEVPPLTVPGTGGRPKFGYQPPAGDVIKARSPAKHIVYLELH